MSTQTIKNFLESEKNVSMLLILSPISGYILAPLSFIAPLVIWLNFKEKFPLVHQSAKELLNFSLNMTVLSLPLAASVIISPYLMITLILPLIMGLIFIVKSIIKIKQNKTYHFPYTIKFIKGVN